MPSSSASCSSSAAFIGRLCLGEGDQDSRGRRAGGAALRGRARSYACGGRSPRPAAGGGAESHRPLDPQRATLGAKPRILGSDGAGERVDTGERVVITPGLDDGRLIVGEHTDGTDAELIAVPEAYVHPIPDGMSFEEAAAFPMVFETAYRMLVTRAGLGEGEWVLVWGIGGGVATASLAIAKALGARVLATSSSDAKLERARELGADAVVNHASGDVAAEVKEATGGVGVDVVVEHVGEATWKTSLAVVRPGGRVGVCCATSGPQPPAQLHRVWREQLTVYRSTLRAPGGLAGALELVESRRA